MDEMQVSSLIDGDVTYVSEEGGLKKYLLQTKVEVRDESDRTQVLSIGTPNSQETKCILLLGETGAGKTTLVNAIINYIYGINFDDDYRLHVKEESVGHNRRETESQTDYITVYIIYHKEGMRHDYNIVVIDTPGLADTRGALQQEKVVNCMEKFLTNDYGIDEIHCIGLVAKACTNRDFSLQKDVLSEIMQLLGNSVPEITYLFATFATEKPVVDQIVRNAGVHFREMFEFDNGILFSPHKVSENIRSKDRVILAYRWENMIEQYSLFFSKLGSAPAVSVKVLREKKLMDKSSKLLKLQVEELARLLTALEINKKKLIKYELQEARNKEWRMERNRQRKSRIRTEEGFHAHNCPQCNQTCIFPCPPDKDSQNAGIIGGMAGVLGGSAAGAAATQATINSVAMATRAATSSGLAASVGNFVTRALGGSVAAAEVGAVGGVPGILVGGMVGITIGVVTGAACGKMLSYSSCNLKGRGDVCGERGCLHSLSQHVKETERIIERSEIEVVVNDDVKELFDVAVSKKIDVMAKIVSGGQKIQTKKKHITQEFLQLVVHFKNIQEITSMYDSLKLQDLFDNLISEVRLGHPDHIQFAVEILQILKKAVAKLGEYGGNDSCSLGDMVMKLLEKIPHEY